MGKSTIVGAGEFSSVRHIDEVFGGYATAEAHAGAEKSSKAQVMTKGEVSLSPIPASPPRRSLCSSAPGWR